MPRLTAPSGVVVSVADDKVDRLERLGYKPVDDPKKAPAKRAASRKSED